MRKYMPCVRILKCEKQPWGSVTKGNILPWVFFTSLKLYRWYQIAKKRHISVENNKGACKMY